MITPSGLGFSASRRRFLVAGAVAGGGLLVGAGEANGRELLGKPEAFSGPSGDVALNAWVRIAPDGAVVVAMPRAEMGQGVQTALALLVAEELGANWSDVRTDQASLARVYGNVVAILDGMPFAADDDRLVARGLRWSTQRLAEALGVQITGGSASVRDAWRPMRTAGATAREMLITAAAHELRVPHAELQAYDGFVVHSRSGRRLGFGPLAKAAARVAPPKQVALRKPQDYMLKGVRRLDVPAKVDGSAGFGIDVRLPDMLYAAVRLAPNVGGSVRSFDAGAIASLPGVVKVVAIPGGVAVVADQWHRARRAAEALPVTLDPGPHASLDSARVAAELEAALGGDRGRVFDEAGDVVAALKRGTNQVTAQYLVPYLAHACLEPVNCTAKVKYGACTLWVGTQVATLARAAAAKAAGVKADKVTVNVPYLGGGFGRRLETDMVVQAVTVARETGGRPVKLLWTREEDTRHDAYRPAAAAVLQASLGANGLPEAWDRRIASASVSADFSARNGLPSVPFLPDKTSAEGAAFLPYRLPNRRVTHFKVDSPVPVGFWRSVGHSSNAFFTECFVDECAYAAKQDPLAYRRALLAGRTRHLRVLDLLAERAGWSVPLPTGRGRGLALHESFDAIVGQVAEVRVEDKGAIRVERVVCVADCGVLVHPDTVRAQMESSIVFGLTAALGGEITIKDGQVEQSNFHDYPLLGLAACPVIQVHLVSSTEPPGGVGEPGVPPVAPSVANALFAATGVRARSLPLNRRG